MSDKVKPGINMAHLEVIANSVNSNGCFYRTAKYRHYDVCAVKTKGGAIAFAVPIGEAPKREDVTTLKPSEIEGIIRQNDIYSERFYAEKQ